MSDKKPYGYIYKTTNLLNGMFYIGMKKSRTFRPSYLGSGKKLKNAVKKYGPENFRVEPIEFSYDEPTQLELEKHYIRFFRDMYGRVSMYNIADGGEGGCGSRSAETRAKLSAAQRGKHLINGHYQ